MFMRVIEVRHSRLLRFLPFSEQLWIPSFFMEAKQWSPDPTIGCKKSSDIGGKVKDGEMTSNCSSFNSSCCISLLVQIQYLITLKTIFISTNHHLMVSSGPEKFRLTLSVLHNISHIKRREEQRIIFPESSKSTLRLHDGL